MPQYKHGDMWSVWNSADLFVITTNSTLRVDGALVMGRGSARQARNRFPGIAAALGRAIANRCGSGGVYGLLVSPSWPDAKLAAFQVKTDWRTAADLDLIRHATAMLTDWCAAHPDSQVHLNLPGAGNGKLSRDVVIPIISALPDTVTIWEYAVANPASAAPFRPTAQAVAAVSDSEELVESHRPLAPSSFVLDDWDSAARKEAYTQFIAAADDAPVTGRWVGRDADFFNGGFACGCAWMQARIRTRHSGRETGHALAG